MVMCGLWAEIGETMFLRNIPIGQKYYMAPTTRNTVTCTFNLCPLLMLFECQMLKTVIKGKAAFTNCKTFECTLMLHICRVLYA
jgi:hypothetical protein